MEICHLITSTSYLECTHAFVMANLISQTREIDLSQNGEKIIKRNMMDMYAKRYIISNILCNIMNYEQSYI